MENWNPGENHHHQLSQPRTFTLLALVITGSLAICPTAISAPAKKDAPSTTIPDFTHGDMPGESHDWTLGPTGTRGWIYGISGHTHASRQILITDVAKDSPADGKLIKGDVILGLDGKNFTDDARVQFAKAIAAAESEKGGGILRLIRWRAGKTDTVDLELHVLGSYSATAPYDCPKSKRIYELGCKALAARMAMPDYGGMNAIPRTMNALALLASGNKEWLPIVKREAEWAANYSTTDMATWYYGYAMILSSEYILATNDQSVLPGLKRIALEAAHGQSAVGTWGHKFALPSGNLNGYGSMNQPGITLMIGMALAREAGVNDPAVDSALTKGAALVRWYVNKGAVPYGDHQPSPSHEENGKCSSAAVLFDLLGDREAAEYFGKMATAAYDERENGHTGNYFNVLWALPGVARCGPLATGAYLKEQAWYYDLARTWDWNWNYQGSPAGEQGQGDSSYNRMGLTGGLLLDYALPLKSLRLTGKKAFIVPPLGTAQVAEVIAAGRDHTFLEKTNSGYDKRSLEELFAGLSSWSPAMRKRSAAALGRRTGDPVPALLKMLASSNRDARYGACEALGQLGPRADAAALQLRALLKDPDPWLESLAAEAIPRLSPKVSKDSVNDLLAMTLTQSPADPRHLNQRAVGVALFSPYPGTREPKSILADSLEGVDRALLIPALRAMLKNDDSVVRASAGKTYKNLTDADLVALLPDIARSVEKLPPSGEMFGDGVRLSGADVLSRLHIREGIALCVSAIDPFRWGAKNRVPRALSYLPRYGTHAKTLLPQLREMRAKIAADKDASVVLPAFDKTIDEIENSTTTPTLVNLADLKTSAASGK